MAGKFYVRIVRWNGKFYGTNTRTRIGKGGEDNDKSRSIPMNDIELKTKDILLKSIN